MDGLCRTRFLYDVKGLCRSIKVEQGFECYILVTLQCYPLSERGRDYTEHQTKKDLRLGGRYRGGNDTYAPGAGWSYCVCGGA